MRFLAVVLGFLWLSVPVQAAEALTLSGPLIQGGLVKGETAPGATVTLDGKALRVDRFGRFVFGFGRDAAKEAVLAVRYPSGQTEERRLAVTQRSYQIQRIDGLPEKMVTPPKALIERIQRENAQIAEARKRDTPAAWFWDGFIRPAEGRISGVYGSQRILNGEAKQPHYGLDIAGPKGRVVIAPAPGVVVLAEPDHYFTGRTLLIDHGYGVSSVMMHLDSLAVKVGDRLEAGDKIGTIGASGRATGPHLDWRVNWFTVRLDPALLIGEGEPGL